MTREELQLLEDFTRVAVIDGTHRFEVATVEWPQPHEPVLRWKAFRSWKRPPTVERMGRAQRAALAATRFFRTCRTCGEHQNAGHMFGADLCQGCAERTLGVVW